MSYHEMVNFPTPFASSYYAPPAHMMMQQGHCRINPLELLKPRPINKSKYRERLHALTPEEKLARRKVKNRAAAQRARDRRKELTFGLEYCVKDLVAENKSLKEENVKLKEDAAVRRAQCTLTHTTHHSYPPPTVATPFGSAVSINELQQCAQGVATVSSSAVKERFRLDRLHTMRILYRLSTWTMFSRTSET